jgi:hypothetical protein
MSGASPARVVAHYAALHHQTAITLARRPS